MTAEEVLEAEATEACLTPTQKQLIIEAMKVYAKSRLNQWSEALSKTMKETLIFDENAHHGAGKQRAIGYNDAIKYISETLVNPELKP
jgi:hypothetical protein